MPLITRHEQTINYEDSGGSGDPLLVVFGLGSTAASAPEAWLSALTRRFRVLRIDNRGVGKSSDPVEPFSIEDMAADAVAVLDAAGSDRAHVYGHSMGGMIAQAIATSWRDRVRRAVFEATAPSPAASIEFTNSSTSQAARQFRDQFMTDGDPELDAEPAITADNAAVFFSFFLAPAYRESPAGRKTLSELVALYTRTRGPSRRTLRWQREAVLRFDYWSRLGEITTPALVVHPAEDVKSLEESRAFAEGLPHGQLRVVPGAGHDVRWEMPELSANTIIEFLGAE
jgi:pimeloyl-ACP methyl ester carboxylesterase